MMNKHICTVIHFESILQFLYTFGMDTIVILNGTQWNEESLPIASRGFLSCARNGIRRSPTSLYYSERSGNEVMNRIIISIGLKGVRVETCWEIPEGCNGRET